MKERFEMVKRHHSGTFKKAINDGKADPQIISLGNFFLELKDFFTSSSCSGRIVLMNLNEQETKREAAFHRKWHRAVSVEEVVKGLNEDTHDELWFKQEPFILHIGARNLKQSVRMLEIMKRAGVRRGGIMVAKDGKFIIELTGSSYMSVPVKSGKKILVSDKHLEYLIEKANAKLERNYAMLERFEKECRKALA